MIRELNEHERPGAHRLVQAAQTQPYLPPAEPVSEYDWKSPVRFTAAQLRKLETATGEIAAELGRALSGLLKTSVQLDPRGVLQHYGADVAVGGPGELGFFAPLAGEDKRRCGWIALSPKAAADWVARLLGGAPSPAAGTPGRRDLSPLERSLLVDIVSASTTAFSAVVRKLGSRALRSQDAIAPQPELAAEEQLQEYCRLSFRGDAKGPDIRCDFIVLSEHLAPLAAPEGKRELTPPAELHKHLLGHLGQAVVEAEAKLGAATLMVQDVMSLEVGDVLVTQTRLGEPIVLEVQGQVVLKAVPVLSDGCYALRVTEVMRAEPPKRPGGN
jgi:flagellar motor switch protein FliM